MVCSSRYVAYDTKEVFRHWKESRMVMSSLLLRHWPPFLLLLLFVSDSMIPVMSETEQQGRKHHRMASPSSSSSSSSSFSGNTRLTTALEDVGVHEEPKCMEGGEDTVAGAALPNNEGTERHLATEIPHRSEWGIAYGYIVVSMNISLSPLSSSPVVRGDEQLWHLWNFVTHWMMLTDCSKRSKGNAGICECNEYQVIRLFSW